jgi:hypothetical protein
MSDLTEKNEQIENLLNDISKTGEQRFVSTNIFSDEDIRLFLYYRSKVVVKDELRIELERLISTNLHSLMDDLPSVFKYEKVPERKLLLASWYDSEDDSDAFRRTDTHYIINKEKSLNAIITFKDSSISKNPLYIFVTGRFGSENEDSPPLFWNFFRVHIKSLRDLIMYVLKDKDLKQLGIQLEKN